MWMVSAPRAKCVTQVRQNRPIPIEVRSFGEPCGQIHRTTAEGILRSGRQHHRPFAVKPGFSMVNVWKRWRLRQNNVRIGAAETERVHASQAFTIRLRERFVLRRNTQLYVVEVTFR